MTLRGMGAWFFLGAAIVPEASAQTPQGTSFTYQGRLTQAGALASGPYDFQFVLYDAPVDGAAVGPVVTQEDVAVGQGLFTVVLDFGSVFGSERRWLELGVRPGADTGPYTPILPRQELTPGPSAIFSAAAADALGLGGFPASQYVQTDDPRLSDARDPLPGSPDYVQNGTVPQPGVSFNVEGTGVASVLDAAIQYNLGGARILSSPGIHNLVAGLNAGASNTTGEANAFFGVDAGVSNTTGGSNSFFGYNAGKNTTTSHDNSFFGDAAGFLNTTGQGGSFFGFLAGANNTTGSDNSFFGRFAGVSNTTGVQNAFFGTQAGLSNTTAGGNAFFGFQAGRNNTTGVINAFFGTQAGLSNTTGFSNAFFGVSAGRFNTTGVFNSIFGSAAGGSLVDGNANAMFGTGAGNVSNGSSNAYFGQGAGSTDTTANQNTFVGNFAGFNNTTGSNNTFVGYFSTLGVNPGASSDTTLLGAETRAFPNLTNATAVGAHALVIQSNSMVLGGVTGQNGGTDTNVGIGTIQPAARLHVVEGGKSIQFGASPGCTGFVGISFQGLGSNCQTYALHGGDGSTHINAPFPGSILFKSDNVTRMTLKSNGFLNLPTLSSSGTTALCRNSANDISTCSSSLRYKSDVAAFAGGLELVERLRPIAFTWKQSGQRDIGLAAEEVSEVEPLLAFRNDQGEIEGVNYSQLTAVLVNALKQQQQEIEALKALVCRASPHAGPCKDGPPSP